MVDLQKILLVEDNPGDAELINEMLVSEHTEFDIQRVDRLSSAVSILQRTEFDAVLLDLGLPDSSGIDTVKTIQTHFPNIPIVVITGTDDSKMGTEAVKNGAQDYIVKGLISGFHIIRVLQYAIQRKRADVEIRKSEQFLRSSLDGLAAHIAIIDENGKIITVNKPWEIFAEENGLSENVQWNKKNYLTVCDKAAENGDVDAKNFANGIRAILNKKLNSFEMVYPCHSPDIERWFLGRATPFPDESLSYVILVHENISKSVTAEEKLRQVQKMEAIGNLAGGVAHDFNNILTSILGFTELSFRSVKNDPTLADNLKEVLTAGKRAKELVNQILTFARKSDERLQPIQVDIILKEAIKFLRSSIPTTIDFNAQIESNSHIMGDNTQIHQIIMNLCTNASHAMEKEGGILDITLKDINIVSQSLSSKLGLPLGDYINMIISDTGTGISPRNISQIFEPYFTTKKKGEGTGMGLAVVYGIVESYGGKIIVESNLDQGTSFKIYFPIIKKYITPEKHNTISWPKGTEQILIIDDEPSIIKWHGRLLEKLGYSVVGKTDSHDALAVFKNMPDAFDLVITDMTMPHMTGRELATEIFKLRSDLPIILCTGFSKNIKESEVSEIGIKALLKKPISGECLATTTRRVLDECKRR